MRLALGVMMAAAALAAPGFTAPTPADPTLEAIGFICSAENRAPPDSAAEMPILPRMGSGGFPIAAKPEAQAWFDYGLKLYYGFYHDDAKTAAAKHPVTRVRMARDIACSGNSVNPLWGAGGARLQHRAYLHRRTEQPFRTV